MANKRKQLLEPEEDQKLLLAFTECKDGEMRTKIQAVRLYGNNVPVAEITNLTGLPRRTINRWYSRYLRLGLSGFIDNRQGGNNTYLTDEQIQDLAKKLNQYRPVDLLGLEKVATAVHLKQILAAYLEKQILLFWDRAKWHGGQAVKQLLDDNPRLEIMKYPRLRLI